MPIGPRRGKSYTDDDRVDTDAGGRFASNLEHTSDEVSAEISRNGRLYARFVGPGK